MTRNANAAVENNGSIGKSRRSEPNLPGYAPTDFELTEFFGGSECLPFWRPPFSLICLFKEEDE